MSSVAVQLYTAALYFFSMDSRPATLLALDILFSAFRSCGLRRTRMRSDVFYPARSAF